MSEVIAHEDERPVLLRVEDVATHYPVMGGSVRRRQVATLRAVDGISFEVREGETLGVVGESGCGKSTLAQTLLRLVAPTRGHVWFRDRDVFAMSRRELREFRRKVQIVLQDPFESLNPRMTVGQIVSEPWRIHPGVVPRQRHRARVGELLELVGLRPEHMDRFPAQFSGGQRQRIGIARAIALEPELIVCDEPVSALDVSVQAQVINLLQDIQQEMGLAMIFIGHDLGVVRHISDTVGVMYLGRMVEYGAERTLFERPAHPYTQALLEAVPGRKAEVGGRTSRRVLGGEIPDPARPPTGCSFRTRCWYARDLCAETAPAVEQQADDPGHLAACHYTGRLDWGDPARSPEPDPHPRLRTSDNERSVS